jgi:hypothetical protein
MGRAIAVRRAAPERIGNLTWPVTPDKHGERESFQTRSRLPSEPTPKCQSFPGGFFGGFSVGRGGGILCGNGRWRLRHGCGKHR